MISSFNLNKDTGTAVLSEIFYESIDEKQVEVKTQRPVKKSLFDKTSIETTPKKNVKQLLTFSDSRQQASFFSMQFNNNHELFLRKRLVWDAIKETQGVNIRSLAMQLTNQIRREGLFSKNQKHEQSEAWISVLQDLMYTSGRYSAQSLGLYGYQFELNPQILYENEAELHSAFQLNVEETITLFNILIDQMRHKCIIDYQVAELSDEEKINAFPYRNREQTIIEKREYNNHKDEYRYVESFLPVQAQRENKTSAYLQKLYPNAKREEIIDIMEKLFTLMCNLGILKETEASQVFSYHIPVEKFKVIPYTKLTWYQCDKCKRVTLYNIHGMCPEHECPGTLHRCDVDHVFANHYYRNNYKTKKIENVIAQEHTAQLKNDKAKQYQIDFKNKKINVLSCSTTFEMGVDLGSLEYVFCRNIPPTPANYIQRAGRAGRSKDASALIMTYCQNESHDYYYYQRPKDMISGKIDPPQFKVENEKIALRHILASAFAHYFRKHPDHFRNISFVYDDHLEPFIDYINSNPKDLVEYIDQWVLKNTNLEAFKQSKWIDALKKDESVLSKYIQETSELVNTLEAAKDKASQSENFRQADYFKNQIDNLNKKNILEDLSKFAIIPKYGFPVDLIRMEVPQDHSVDLQRDLLIGISEYAPDSEVIADEKKFVSRYIELPKKTGKELTKTYYYTCEECHDTQVSLEPFEEGSLCPTCFKPYKKTDLFFLEPRFGFVASNEKRSKNIKPIKSYAGEIRYLGKGLPFKEKVLLANKIRLTAIQEDRLAMINEGHFYYCKSCGYTKRMQTMRSNTIKERKKHRDPRGFECENTTLQHTALGYVFKTDVVRLKINSEHAKNRDWCLSLLYGLLNALSQSLQIERNDINGLLVTNSFQEFEFILFDQVPGGAGHVQRLADENTLSLVLNCALDIVSQDCCEEESSCYRCLRTYRNRREHQHLKRKYAKQWLEELLEI